MTTALGTTGYGICGYSLLKSLTELGVNVSLFPIGQDCVAWADKQLIQKCISSSHFFDYNAPSIRCWHQFSLSEKIGKGPAVALSFFELDPLSPLDVHHLNSVDLVLLSSKWAEYVAKKSGVKTPIKVTPLGVDPSIFFPRPTPPHGPCIFLNIGKFEVRKGHHFLPKAFNETFNVDDNVELWLMPNAWPLPPEEKAKWVNLYMNTPLGQNGMIRILEPVATHQELAEIVSLSTCGLYPALAEGWNMELMECLAMGKLAIATNYSAHTEFATKDNCMLIDIDEITPAIDGKWFNGKNGNWAVFGNKQGEQLKEYMREVYKKFESGSNMVNEQGIETGKKYTWENTAKLIMDALK